MAPPSDGIQRLTACTRCGLVFDAAPREPVQRRRPTSRPRSKQRRPSALTVTAIVVGLAGAAAVAIELSEADPAPAARPATTPSACERARDQLTRPHPCGHESDAKYLDVELRRIERDLGTEPDEVECRVAADDLARALAQLHCR